MRNLALLVLATALAIGCSRHHGVDTGPVVASFKTADPTLKIDADKAVAAIKAGNLPEALTQFQRLAGRAKLSAEQQQAIKDTIAAIQQQMQAAANKSAENAKKASPQEKRR